MNGFIMTNRRKVLLIGMDGFTWTLGKTFMAEGVMPNLSKLVDGGCHGNLESVIPFSTAPAWTAFMTGCKPGKTGVFDFYGYDRQHKRIHLNSYNNIAVPTLWELADKAGKVVVSLNLPMTSPPPRVNGVIIPGITCPRLSRETVHPPQAYDKYIRAEPDYRIVDTVKVKTAKKFVDRQIATEQARCRVGLRLMNDFDWDIYCYQMQSTDHIQHDLWSALDESVPSYCQENHQHCLRFYRACDDIIGQLLDEAGRETLVLMASDHGFTRVENHVRLNAWLLKKGYIKVKLSRQDKVRKFKNDLKSHIPGVRWLAQRYGELKQYCKGPNKTMFVRNPWTLLDMEHTSAFVINTMAALVYLNGTAEQRTNLARKITAQLLEDMGPDSDCKVITRISDGDKVSLGLGLDEVPDLLVEYRTGVFGHPEFYHASSNMPEIVSKPDMNDPMALLGTHHRNGIYVAYAPGVIPGRTMDAKIIDVTPTVLGWLGLPVPNHMDGRVLSELFENFPQVHYSNEAAKDIHTTEYTDAEQAQVEKHLRDLGYL